MNVRWAALALLVGCGAATGGGTGEAADEGTGICPQQVEPSDAVQVTDVNLTANDGFYEPPSINQVSRLTSQTELDALLGELGATSDPVDFDSQDVLVLWGGKSSTCGLMRESLRQVRGDGMDLMELVLEDTSGACEEACDMARYDVVAFAVPNDVDLDGCVRIRDTCDEGP